MPVNFGCRQKEEEMNSTVDLTQQMDATATELPRYDVIYPPAGQAGEYARYATNIYRGCGHGCAYCYVPAVMHMTRADFDAEAVPSKDFLNRLKKSAKKCQDAGMTEQVLLCFGTDPYHPGDTALTRETIKVLREHRLAFCTLTKGGQRALRDLDLFRPGHDAFASTLTSLDNSFSEKWERKAALPEDRIATLKVFHDRGIFTWVSLEPTLDAESSLAIVERTHSFVDLYKIGKLNYVKGCAIDWRDYTLRMVDLCSKLGVRHYIKHDLAEYLPAGYHNPVRVAQHQ
jgi:DNA repair photolyase